MTEGTESMSAPPCPNCEAPDPLERAGADAHDRDRWTCPACDFAYSSGVGDAGLAEMLSEEEEQEAERAAAENKRGAAGERGR